MSLLKKLAGETAIYGVSSILSRLLNYVILTPFLTRYFIPKEYSVLTIMYAYSAFLMIALTFRMETTFFRFASKDGNLEKTYSTAGIALLIVNILAIAGLLFFSQDIANYIKYPNNKDYVIWFIFIIGFDALSAIPFARLRLENRPIKFALLKISSILVNIFFIFFFLKGCPYFIENGWTWLESIFDSDNKIAYVFISNFLGSAIVLLLLLPEYLKIKLKFDLSLWKKMLHYAMPLVIVGVAAIINQLLSVILMKEWLPGTMEENEVQIGIYGACFKIAILMNLFIQAFNYAAEPFFFRNSQRSDAKNIYAQVGQAFAFVGSLVFLGIMLYLDIIQHFIDSEYWSGLGIAPILLLAFLCLGLYYNFSIWYKLKDKTIIGAYISVTGAIITIVLNILLLPIIGFVGAAWAALACYGFMAIASYITGQRYYPINYPMGKILLYIGFSISAYFISTLIRPFLGENLFFILTINTVILLGFVFILYLLEKDTVKDLLKAK